MAESNIILEPQEGYIPTGRLVVLQLASSVGRFALPPGAQTTSEEGIIRSMGCKAFGEEHAGMFAVDDRVMFRRYGGQQFRRWADEEFVPGKGATRKEDFFCIVNDTDILIKIVPDKNELFRLPEASKTLTGEERYEAATKRLHRKTREMQERNAERMQAATPAIE